MGNLHSSSTNVFLSVNDSRTCITAGSILTGEIRCPDHSVSNDLFSGVTLYFIGKEEVEVRYAESGHGSKGGGPKYKSAKRDIVRHIIPLDTSNRSVAAGSYPFQFHVPDQLPSSMYYKDGNGGFCCIRYKVKLHIMSRRGRDQEIPIEIMAKPPSPTPFPSSVDPMTTRMQLLYCLPQGSMTWAAGVDDTRVGVGEELKINLGMKNESLVKIERVTAKLKQTVEWHTSGHSSTNKSIIRSSSFDKADSFKERTSDQLRTLKYRSKQEGGVSQATQPRTVYEEVLDTVKEGKNQLTFRIPEYVPQSYTGKLIKIQHFISINAKTPSCFNSPKVHIPIEVTSPRNTLAPTVTAHVIPMPSAPAFLSEESYDLRASDVNTPFTDASFVMGVPVNEEEEIVFNVGEQESLMNAITDTYPAGHVLDSSEQSQSPAERKIIESF